MDKQFMSLTIGAYIPCCRLACSAACLMLRINQCSYDTNSKVLVLGICPFVRSVTVSAVTVDSIIF
jgi:hypothetical protein